MSLDAEVILWPQRQLTISDQASIPSDRRPLVQFDPSKRYAYRFIKRFFDIVFSSAAILIGVIPSLVLCLAIVIDSPGGGPLYTQMRIGRNGKPFKMYKFRSMVPDAEARLAELKEQNEATGPLFKMQNDPRITRVGRYIRKHSIDELPQMLNVFLGQMSLVGPRPCLGHEYDEYTLYDRQRLLMKSGCSGYWQIRGRGNKTFDEMVELDIAYINDSSPITDLMVIGKTIIVMFTGEGAC